MHRSWAIACLGLLGVFGAALVLSLDYPLHDAIGPGPGFFPFWLSMIGLAFSAALLVQAVRGEAPVDGGAASDEALPAPQALLRALAVLATMILAVASLDPLGFRLTALIFVGVLLPMLGARAPLAIALCAVAASFGVFHVFYFWLKVPLPIGAFGL